MCGIENRGFKGSGVCANTTSLRDFGEIFDRGGMYYFVQALLSQVSQRLVAPLTPERSDLSVLGYVQENEGLGARVG